MARRITYSVLALLVVGAITASYFIFTGRYIPYFWEGTAINDEGNVFYPATQEDHLTYYRAFVGGTDLPRDEAHQAIAVNLGLTIGEVETLARLTDVNWTQHEVATTAPTAAP